MRERLGTTSALLTFLRTLGKVSTPSFIGAPETASGANFTMLLLSLLYLRIQDTVPVRQRNKKQENKIVKYGFTRDKDSGVQA